MHDAILVHEEIVSLGVQRNRIEVRLAALLVQAETLEIWRQFGCAHVYEYLERYCDLQPRTAREHLRVARALDELPLMRAALADERIRYSIARELTRIATPETEETWLRETAGMTAREVEEEIAGRVRGDRPHDPKDPDQLVTLSLQVRESTFAAFVHARMRYVDACGERMTDDDLVLALCRGDFESEDANAAAGAAGDTDAKAAEEAIDAKARHGAPPYQLAITTCRACARSFQVTAGRELEVTAAMRAMAECDARHLGDLEAEHPVRSTTSVTPRMRQHVLLRDRFACTVPGCRSKRFLDVHHIRGQAAGGAHAASNLTTLCGGHHRQLHEDRLRVSGQAPHALAFSWPADPRRTSTRGVWSGAS